MAGRENTAQTPISASSLSFLTELKHNNNRDWFALRKNDYQQELSAIESFAETLLQLLNTHDVIETATGKKSLHRIYRDTRFSLNKTPYNTHWSGSFKRATKYRRGGYHFHIEPGNSFIAGGFWMPEAQDIKLVRDDIAFDPLPLRDILKAPAFVSTFKALQGEQLKTTPKGYPADHEAIDLLRYKQYLLKCSFSDAEVLSPDFINHANQTFINMRPFFDYMSEVLSTDVNGSSVF
jgi:uncharacterized protein (TIGR02453 family)